MSRDFTKSVIKSPEACDHEQGQIRVNDKSQTDPLTQGMRTPLMLPSTLSQNGWMPAH